MPKKDVPVATRRTTKYGAHRKKYLPSQRKAYLELHGLSSANLGSEFTEDEVEFMLAMDRYKRVNHRPFPTWREVLSVVKSLGYDKK